MLGLFSTHPAAPEVVAAVDLGSNSFHMIVAKVENGHIHVLDKLRELVRLASGLDEQKNLSPEIQARALACLERFGQRLRAVPSSCVRVVGTNTLRTAHNSRGFLREAEAALGHPIEVIAGREEARLIYLGVAHSLADTQEKRLVMDIGGGSTEFIIGQGFHTLRRESLHMGCVTMSQRFFTSGEYSAKIFRKAEIAARLELQPIVQAYRQRGWEKVVGASGSIKSIGRIVETQGWSKQGINLESLHMLREAMLKAGHADRLKLEGLDPERIPVLPGGLAVLLGSFEELGIQHMDISDGALREGLIFDLLGRLNHQDDVRESTIKRLQQRYQIDAQQAQAVSDTACELLRQVCGQCSMGTEEHQHLLNWAAQLHEIGMIIAHNQYHKHGDYILRGSDLAGFSNYEQNLLASLVRGHRRKFPLSVLEDFNDQAERVMIKRLCVVLRLAVLLHRSRIPDSLPDLSFGLDETGFNLRFPSGWLEQHPLTLADLENEQTYLAAANIQFQFE